MDIELISAPYHLGQFRVGMGNGPEAILAYGAAASLEATGCRTRVTTVHLSAGQPNEVIASFNLQKLVGDCVRSAVEHESLPIALTGNCNTAAIGMISGLPRNIGIVWFDAHADFETPETTLSGFLDGMALSMATGDCWHGLREGLVGSPMAPANRIVLIGMRDSSRSEMKRLDTSGITLIGGERVCDSSPNSDLDVALRTLASKVDGVYLHIDLDVLDSSIGRANAFASPGGLSVSQLAKTIAEIGSVLPIYGAGIASYDPAEDNDGSIADAGLKAIASIARNARRTA